MSSMAWIDLSLPICYDISETPKFHMDYNLHSGILLDDAHSNHILIILVLDSERDRNDFLNFNETRAGHRTDYRIVYFTLKNKPKLYGPFLWMGFNCLKGRATSRRQFSFYH